MHLKRGLNVTGTSFGAAKTSLMNTSCSLAHGKSAAAAATPKAAAKPAAKEAAPVTAQKALSATPDEAAMRNRVLNEVLDAFSDLDDAAGIEGALKVIQSLKKKQKALAEEDKAER
jgi:hypothetical protein